MKYLIPIVLAAPAVAANDDFDVTLPAPVVDSDYRNDGRHEPALVELGRQLFFDKVLSGNRNISCATCHHPEHATGDGLALPLGEGAKGLGPERRAGHSANEGVFGRVPRNSPALFNLGASEFTTLFHDGRVEEDPQGYFDGGFITPAKWKLPPGLDSVLAAQAMFPVTSPDEMAGQQTENDVADARAANQAAGDGGVWDRIAGRLRDIPEYVELFQGAFPDDVEDAEDISFVLAANAIAAFESDAFRADDSPFDRHLRGTETLSSEARRGMKLFYGKAGCHTCHSGKFQTDHDFHAIAMPQIGPGKSDGWDGEFWRATGLKAFPEDHGRARETAREGDRYRFRTPSLRNVAATGPWGHAGAYASLEDVIRHHLDPVAALEGYALDEETLPELASVWALAAVGSRLTIDPVTGRRREAVSQLDGWVQSNSTLRGGIADANELQPVALEDQEVGELVAFLESLTDPSSLDRVDLVPERVPSGLPVAD